MKIVKTEKIDADTVVTIENAKGKRIKIAIPEDHPAGYDFSYWDSNEIHYLNFVTLSHYY